MNCISHSFSLNTAINGNFLCTNNIEQDQTIFTVCKRDQAILWYVHFQDTTRNGWEMTEKWLRNGWEMTEKWMRNEWEMNEKWLRNGWEMTEKWMRND